MFPGSFDATATAAGPSCTSPQSSGLTEISDTEEEMDVAASLDTEAQMIEVDPYLGIWGYGGTTQTPEITFNAWGDTPDSRESKGKEKQDSQDEVRLLIYFNLG